MQASPTSTTRPICTKMLTDLWVNSTPATEQSRHSGTTRITASGSVQLSYRAARARKTHTTARAKTYIAVLPARICMNISSVHSLLHGQRQCLAGQAVDRRAMASPELTPGAQVAGDGAAEDRL